MNIIKLSIIVPIRTNDFSFYYSKLNFRSNCNLTNIETVIVDDGSCSNSAKLIYEFCMINKFKYVRIESGHMDFSLARARNSGLFNAQSDWIFMDDADMVYPVDFFQKVILEIENIDHTPFNFYTVPAIYLSEQISNHVIHENDIDKYVPQLVSASLLENTIPDEHNHLIQHYAPSSAILIFKKSLALLAGGYDESFVGWGGEDRDFVFKLLMLNNSIVDLPLDFANTKSWNLNDTVVYEGWRSLYNILGNYFAFKGLYAFHIFHHNNSWRDDSSSTRIDKATTNAKNYYKSKQIFPIVAPTGKIDLIVGCNPHIMNSAVMSVLNNPFVIKDSPAVNPLDFYEEVIGKYNINSVIMWNPFGLEWRLELSNIFKENGYKVIIGERGALPNSIYFDENGFCIDSSSYNSTYWDKELSADEISKTSEYISKLRFSDNALEKQSQRCSAWQLYKNLGIPEDKKIIFVPFQLFDDTVTTLFTEDDRTYSKFIEEIRKATLVLPCEWVIVYKNHPLSIKKIVIDGAVNADKVHVHDLLESCSLVSLFNSGTGVLAMSFNKYVLYYGKCFYSIDGINSKLRDANHLVEFIKHTPSVDQNRVIKFYNYLVHNFYSFASWGIIPGRKTAYSSLNNTTNIRYSIVRVNGYNSKSYSTHDIKKTRLFSVYKYYHYIQRTNKMSKTSIISTETQKINYGAVFALLCIWFKIVLPSTKYKDFSNDPYKFMINSTSTFTKFMRKHVLIKTS